MNKTSIKGDVFSIKNSVITSKAIDSNEEYSHYFAMRTIELNAVRMSIFDIAVGFDEKFSLWQTFD